MKIRTAIQSHLSDALIEMNHPQLQEQAELRLRFIKWLMNIEDLDIDDKYADIHELWDKFNLQEATFNYHFSNN
jgi:hypothetical protein